MSRSPRLLLAVLAFGLVVGLCPIAGTDFEASAQTIDRREPTFRERLVTGLEARRPSELLFLDAVADTVERGHLPQRLVDRFFFWARKKQPRSVATRRPIIYFEQGLSLQAKQLGIKIVRDEDLIVVP